MSPPAAIAILAAGRGTRLRPLTFVVPKALLAIPFAGKKLISWALEASQATPFPTYVLVRGKHADRFRNCIRDPRITVASSDFEAETGGEIMRHVAMGLFTPYEHIVVLPSDYHMQGLDINVLVSTARSQSLDLLLLCDVPQDSGDFVLTNDSGRAITIVPTATEHSYIGIYVVRTEALLRRLDLCNRPLTTTALLNQLLLDGCHGAVHVFNGHWRDLGSWGRYVTQVLRSVRRRS